MISGWVWNDQFDSGKDRFPVSATTPAGCVKEDSRLGPYVAHLSCSFSVLRSGICCVSIDPQCEPNLSILRPGVWTYPAITQDVISTTVTLAEGEYKGMVNFGWDFQFQP